MGAWGVIAAWQVFLNLSLGWVRADAALFLPIRKLGWRLMRMVGLGLGMVACAARATTVQVDVLDSAGQPIAGAVVFLESADARRQVKPVTGMEMVQEKKQFVPAVMVVPLGTSVHFPNHDAVRHHVYSFSAAKKFELKLYAGTPSNPVVFDQPGVVTLGCNIHDQMVGWIVVVETPYYAQTAGTGKVQLDNVPAGSYRLRTWHSRLPVGAPALDQPLQVPATGMASAAVRMPGLVP